MASCRRCSGTSSRSGPSPATIRTSDARPASAPSPAGRQPRTVATASTMVSASTASTSEARNAAVTAGPICAQAASIMSCLPVARVSAACSGRDLARRRRHEFRSDRIGDGLAQDRIDLGLGGRRRSASPPPRRPPAADRGGARPTAPW